MARPSGPTLDRLAIIDDHGRRLTVHPADVSGPRIHARRIVFYALILFFMVLPWISVNGDPLVRLDIARRSFHVFGLTLNAQDGPLLFFVLTGIGFSLFIVSTTMGRLWCGWSCPQTVFLEGIFRRIERAIDGNDRERRALEQAPWTAHKIGKRLLKNGVFLALSLFIGHTLAAYFTGARELVAFVTEGPARHPFAFGFSMAISGILFFDMAWFREQVCLIICPYGRLQSVLADDDTSTIGYDKKRGEPRGKATDPNAGACVDCRRCVAVCPTGIDIRNGLQLDCIGCGQCADACDEVMAKLGRPKGLVRTDSLRGLSGQKRRFLRPRLIAYGVAAVVGLSVATFMISRRVNFEANVVRPPGPPYLVSDGMVTNPVLLHLVSKRREPVTVSLTVDTPITVETNMPKTITLQPEESRTVPAVLRFKADAALPAGATATFTIRADDDGSVQQPTTKLLAPTANSTSRAEPGRLNHQDASGAGRPQ
jgi:cytochrome c oxidase accessory protein FixG